MQPCVGGERDVKRVLLLNRNEEDRERWLRQLSRITLSREDPSQKPPSPLSNSRSLRPGSMRLGRARPPSAREQRAAPTSNATNLPTRAFSVSVRPDSAGAPRPYATYSPSSTSTTRFRHPLPAELMNIQHSADFGDSQSQ